MNSSFLCNIFLDNCRITLWDKSDSDIMEVIDTEGERERDGEVKRAKVIK